MADEQRSPLYDAQVAAGGGEPFLEDGWPWFMNFGDAVGEFRTIRTATGLWDLFSAIKYVVTGPDATRLIQRRFTNDLSTVTDGGVRYGAVVNADGKMVDEGNVYKHSNEKYWITINTSGLADWFRETAGGLDATVEERTLEMPLMSATGPGSRDLLQKLTDYDLSSLRYYRFETTPQQVGGVTATIMRTSFSGELGFEMITDPASAPTLWQALNDAGGRPFGLDAIEIARVEAGLVILGLDYTPGETSPWDVSLDRVIKTDTENVGAEALKAAGANPAKRMKTLTIEGDALPEAGTAVTKDGAEVGTVTSPVTSPDFGVIALAVLDSGAATDGEKVDVGGSAATVGPLSIHDPEKKKARS
jgi:aminomethyltransferase